jgi:hypothetical protein
MTRLVWDTVGERFYESGVDRGVLYLDTNGYAWPGLVTVTESPTGGDPRPFYVDGYKYLNVASAEEFEATIEAFSAPAEFGACDGVNQVYAGLFITQQPRKSFGFCYRSRVGNDVNGLDHAYKLHLVYNALAAPSEKAYSTINDQAEAPTRSWKLTTLAPKIMGYRPTAHFVIDSRSTPAELLTKIEDILYGSDEAASRLPLVDELLYIFTTYGTETYDAGTPDEPYFDTIDAGTPSNVPTEAFDGGTP